MRLGQSLVLYMQRYRERLAWRTEKLASNNLMRLIEMYKNKIAQIRLNSFLSLKKELTTKKALLGKISARLYALNPTDILARGYSITRTIPERFVITDLDDVSAGQELEIILTGGSLQVVVKGKTING